MIRVEDLGRVRMLSMEHGKVNALDIELLDDLIAALDAAESSSAAAIVLTGTGTSFSAGVDLYRLLDGGPAYVDRFLPRLTTCLTKLFVMPKPVVAAVNGHAIAGGCILACASDVRWMAAGRARVGVPELLVGVPFPVVALEIVRAATTDAVAARLAVTGSTHLPDEALRLGLIDAVVEPEALLDRARESASQLAGIPARSYALVKRQLRWPALDRCERLAAHDEAVHETWRAPETAQAIRAYLERTIPKK